MLGTKTEDRFYAMSVHSILDHESDSLHAGLNDADGEMDLFIEEFYRVYGKKGVCDES